MEMRRLHRWQICVLGSVMLALVLQLVAGRSAARALQPPATPRVAPGVTPEVVYRHPDSTGNLYALTDASGAVVWRAEVRPFGRGTANPADRALHFLDQPLEEESGAAGGLYHLSARTYDPVAGRFLSTDPLPVAGVVREEPQRFNAYAYGLNNPYRYMDPTGLAPEPTKPPQRQPRRQPGRRYSPTDPVTGRPVHEGIREPTVIDLDPEEETTEIIRIPGTVTEEVTEVKPVKTDQTTPSLGEVVPKGFDPDNERQRQLLEDQNRLACAYGMDSCFRPNPMGLPAFTPLPGVGPQPLPALPNVPQVNIRPPLIVRPVLVP